MKSSTTLSKNCFVGLVAFLLVLLSIDLTQAQIFVANQGNNTVGEYNSTTGAAINSAFVSSGLVYPYCLAVSGNDLFVATDSDNTTVGEYNATTGSVINASFITGLSESDSFAISGNALYVSNFGSNQIAEYNATTGATINASLVSVNSPSGIAISVYDLFVESKYGKE